MICAVHAKESNTKERGIERPDRRIRVMQIIPGLTHGDVGGGAEIFATRLSESLNTEQFEPSICCLWVYHTEVERDLQNSLRRRSIQVCDGAPVRGSFRRQMIDAFASCHRHVHRLRPDVVNTHTEPADLVGVALRGTSRFRALVRTCHNTNEWTFAPHIRPIALPLYPWLCSVEVAVSPAATDILNRRKSAKLAGKSALYIPNTVDIEAVLARRTAKDVHAEFEIDPGAPLFGAVGRLTVQKGFIDLIRAMALVRAELPAARLLIVGAGEQQAELQALIHELNLNACVVLTGPRKDAIDIIAALDVFVLPSLWEGLPTVIMEAMALETPVVATNVAGSDDLVIDGKTGLLTPPRDPDALAAVIVRQYRDRDRAKSMTRAARQHVEQFTVKRTVEQYSELYQRLCK
jgi:glycosyltransferase involved in cell wall biosynthesis